MKSKIRKTVDAALAAKTDEEAIRILKGRKPRRFPRRPRKQDTGGPTAGPLESILKHIELAGGVPTSKFRRALAAARNLDALCAQPMPPIEGSDYKVTLSNGKDVTLFVPKGSDIFKLFKMEGYDVVSFCKIK